MRPSSAYLLGLLGAATVAFARHTEPIESNTVSLTKATFHNFIEEHDLVLVNFYSPSCSHCRRLAPKYEEAATELKENNVPLAKVNCLEDAEFCRDMGVTYYPKMEVFRGLESRELYRGERTTESYVIHNFDGHRGDMLTYWLGSSHS
jgi:protein disulfide-isomerase A1